MFRRSVSLAAGVLVFLLAIASATGDTLSVEGALKLQTSAVCTTEGGSTISIPPSRILPEPIWLELDLKVSELEDDKTRLTSENKALKASEPIVGWKSAIAALIVGILVDRYALDR